MSRRRFAAIGRFVAGAVLIDADMLTLVAGLAILAARKYAVLVACAINLDSPSRRRRWAVDRLVGVGIMLLLALLWPASARAQTTQVVEYYHTDALGSVRAVTNQQGQVIRRHDFMPFGEEIQPTVPPLEKRLFTGKERDAETGLDYFGARYYRPQVGRFTTIDPVMTSAHLTDPQTFNRYAYARNNPLRYVDLDGRDVSKACIADQKCTIELKVNVIYDKRHPLSDQQKAAMEKSYLDKAQADYKHSNIQVAYTYTEGRMVASGGQLLVVGARSDMLNAVFTTGSEASVNAGGAFNSGTLFVNVAHPGASESNTFLRGNTFEHEMAHVMRGGVRNFFSNITEDSVINASLLAQSWGRSISAFLEGLEHRAFAVEANPAARVPKQ